MAAAEEKSPLLAEEGGVRSRRKAEKKVEQEEEKWEASKDPTWNPDLPYGGRVYLAKKGKPDPWWVTTLEILAVIFVVGFSYYAYYYFDNLHFHVAHGYAKLGYSSAQHQVGQRYLHGKGVDKDHYEAMDWFKKASDQGHPHASYNLAVGHIQGIRKDILERGEAHRLIHHAASNGVPEANKVLQNVCSRGGCE